MEISNEYSEQEDLMMWKLKEVRKLITKKNLSPSELNQSANQIILKFKLNCKRFELIR